MFFNRSLWSSARMETALRSKLRPAALAVLSCAIVAVPAAFLLSAPPETKASSLPEQPPILLDQGEAAECLYLSDLPYASSSVQYGTIGLDKNSVNNKALSLKLNGSTVSFKKGIFAHATSTIVYDISGHKGDYDYLVTYYGIDTSSNNVGNGAKFYIYTSADGEDWQLRTDEDPVALKSNDNAGHAKVSLDGVNYVKLYIDNNGANASDHSEWADTKLVHEGYTDNVTRTVEELDAEIKAHYTEGPVPEDMQLLLLQRNLVASVGQYGLRTFLEEKPANREMLEWFLNDEEALRLWTMAGAPNGSYINSLQVLSNLYAAHKEDLEDDTVRNGVRNGDLNLHMMLALSLTHARAINLWIYNNQPSDAVTRYEIFKDMYANNKLGSPSMFANFTVEEMRWVMTAAIDDESILWLRDYTSKFGDGNQYSARFNPYTYITYRLGYAYGSPRYYSEANYAMWDAKYHLSDYGITYKSGFPKLWIVFEEGSVCGGLSKTGSNIQCSWGYPATPVGQPGHCAYIYMYNAGGGKNAWQLTNSIVANGWANTTPTMMPYGWGSGGANVTNNGTIQSSSYMFLSQEAQNEYEKFEKANMLMLMAKVYRSDWDKLVQIYNDAYDEEHINLDAWNGLINIALDSRTGSTQEDLYALAEQCASDMKYHPLPMYDLTRRLGAKITDPAIKSKFMMLVNSTLQEAAHATSAQSIQAKEINAVANALLGYIDNTIATFSFDGANANKIMLAKAFQGTGVAWEYTLDGGATWNEVHEDAVELTPQQVASINATDDIKVHIIGVPREGNLYTIDITQPSFSTAGLSSNDDENRFYGATNLMEYYLSEDLSSTVVPEDATWLSFSTAPNLEGNKRLFVRNRPTGTKLATNYVWYTYRENVIVEDRNYIAPSHLSIAEAHGGASAGSPANILDGNGNTYWTTGTGALPHTVTIEMDEPRFLSGFDLAPKILTSMIGVKYGNVKQFTLSVSLDGETWTDVLVNESHSGYGAITKTFAPVQAKYVRFTALKGETMNDGSLPMGAKGRISIADVKLYEDLSADPTPKAKVRYDIWSKTNHDVVAELVDATRPITVTNTDGGATTHTFTDNGSFTFEFEDAAGNKGNAVATVDWIDKTAPTMNVEYSTTAPTSDDVVATLSFSEPVEITSDSGVVTAEDGTRTLTFTDNGSVSVEFEDEVGNSASQTVTVSNIDREAPTAQIKYSTTDITDGEVTATCLPDKEGTQILSEGGDTHTFDANGTHTFEMLDAAGNVGYATAEVTWIKHVPVMHLEYSSVLPTRDDVTATLVVESGDIRIMNNSGRSSYTFAENGSFDFEYLDEDNMSGRITATVSNIDKEVPTATVSYDTKTLTNGRVVATITPSEEVEITSEGGTSHTFTDNGEFEFTFVDRVGNEGSATAKVTWIDKIAPTATVSYSTTDPTDGEVVATITPSEEVTVTKPVDGSFSYTFETNGTYTFEFVDAAGNKGSATAEASWIESPLPETHIEYVPSTPTNGNVVATLVSDGDITVVNGDGTATHTFTDNGGYTFEFVDGDGNRGSLIAEVTWIDRVAPTGWVEYSTTDPTNRAVTASLYIDNDEPVTLLDAEDGALKAMMRVHAENASVSPDSSMFAWSPQRLSEVKALLATARASVAATRTFTENGKHMFVFADAAGNRGSVVAEVSWIDTSADAHMEYETIELNGKKAVKATLVADEDGLKVINNDGSNEHVFYENGEFVFEVEDALGNKASIVAKVDSLPKDPTSGGDDGNENENGNTNTGENTNTGGNTGDNTNAGGNTNTGDNTNTGGNANTGGNTNTGSNTNTGDNTTPGGNTNTGSNTNTGDNTNTGGNTGNENTGGNTGNENENTGDDSNAGSNTNTPGNANIENNGNVNGNGNEGNNTQASSNENTGGLANTGNDDGVNAPNEESSGEIGGGSTQTDSGSDNAPIASTGDAIVICLFSCTLAGVIALVVMMVRKRRNM